MSNYLNVSAEDIESLSDTDLRELIARLAEAEVKSAGYSTNAVTWGGDQRAKDGGIDVRVSLGEAEQISGYIPSPQTGFQVKAEDFSRADIVKEMMPNGQIRPSISELAAHHGAYVIASSKSSVADRPHKDRLAAMEQCLSKSKLSGRLIVEFFDRRRIATWTEKFPSLVAWVRARNGRGTEGWQSFGAWAHRETDASSQYLLDEKAKVFVPNSDDGITVSAAIERIRSELMNERASIRITGLSGVGKTRLVQALFDERVNTSIPPLSRTEVLYTDLSDEPNPIPIHMADALQSRNDRGLLIVDNCGFDLHQRLTEKVQQPNSKLSLVTVEYDIREHIPEGTISYRLEPCSDGLIRDLVGQRYPGLTRQDIDTISQFSGGNVRVAFALAETSTDGGQLSKLEDEQLFIRLFQQAKAEDNELLRAGEACSMLYSFEGELDRGDDAELPTLAALVGMPVGRLYAHVEELKRRGLVQQRGRWRAVLPHAIANRLAQRAFQNFPRQLLQRTFVDEASERIARSFSRRLGYLHEEKVARTIASDWLRPGGLLGQPDMLTELGQDMFGNIAAVDPSAALAAIGRCAENHDFLATRNGSRSKFIRILKSVSYDPDLFEQSVATLVLFARAEPERYNQNSATQALKSLFYVHFSGTETPPDRRAALIQRYLSSDDSDQQEIGLTFLSAALMTSNFSPSQTFDFGARSRSYGWHPKTKDDVREWFGSFLDIVLEFGNTRTALGARIRSILAERFRGLWLRTPVLEELDAIANAFVLFDGWPGGWRAVKATIPSVGKDPVGKRIDLLQALDARLTPVDLAAEIRAKVLVRGQFLVDDELLDGSVGVDLARRHTQWQERMRQLGQRAGPNRDVLAKLLSDLTVQQARNCRGFGIGVGETIDDPISYLTELRQAIGDPNLPNLSFGFIRPFLEGAGKEHSDAVACFMEEAIRDEIWGPHFPMLQTSVPLDDAAVERLLCSVALGLAPAYRFGVLGVGMATDPLSEEQIERLIFAIAAAPEGQECAAEVLSMVIHLADNKSARYRHTLRGICRGFLHRLDWDQEVRDDHNFEMICRFAFVEKEAESNVLDIMRLLRKRFGRHEYYRLPNVLNSMFQHHATVLLDEIFEPDSDGEFRTAGAIISATHSDDYTRPINSAPISDVISWCSIELSVRTPFIAQYCAVLDQDQDENTKAWSPLALALIDCANNRTEIFRILVDGIKPMSSSGSLAASIRSCQPLLEQLAEKYSDIPPEEISGAKARLEAQAVVYERFEQKHYRDWDERFE